MLILYKKLILSDHSAEGWAWNSHNFICLNCLYYWFWGEVVLKLQKLRWTNIWVKIDFEQSVWEVRVALAEFYLLELSLLLILGECCFKAPKVTLDHYFYHWNVQFYYFCAKSWLWAITVIEDGCGTCWILFTSVISVTSIREKLF